MNEKLRNKKGITLIALVITIIVLLILAAITIATLTGKNGILANAQRAKEENSHAQVKEQIQIAVIEYNIQKKKSQKSTYSSSIDYLGKNGYLTGYDEKNVLDSYVIPKDKLNGASLGKGTDKTTGNVYVIEKENLVTGSTEKIASLETINTLEVAEESTELYSWVLRYYKTETVSRTLLDLSTITQTSKNPDDSTFSTDATPIYAKLYSNDIGKTLEFSNNPDYVDTADGFTLENEYGNISSTNYYYNHNDANENFVLPPWVQVDLNGKNIERLDIKKIKIVDEITPKSTVAWFANLEFLETIENIENLNLSEATNTSYMFNNCTSLTQLDLSHSNASNATDMSYMFNNCYQLASLNFGNNFDTSKVKNMSYMFSECSSLMQLDLRSFDTSNVTDMSYMFNNCTSLTQLDLSHSNASNATDMSYMFNNCDQLASLNFGNNFDTSKVKNMSYMFSECSSLIQLDLRSFNTSNVTDMSHMFSWCSDLTQLDLSSFDTSEVKDMWSMFVGCSNLSQLDLSSFDTSKVKHMQSMFEGCSSLEIIYVSSNWRQYSTAEALPFHHNRGYWYYVHDNNIDDTIDEYYYDYMFDGCGINTLTKK